MSFISHFQLLPLLTFPAAGDVTQLRLPDSMQFLNLFGETDEDYNQVPMNITGTRVKEINTLF